MLNDDQLLKRNLHEQANADRNDRLDVYPKLASWRETRLAQRVKFNSNFKCGELTILPYELIHSRNRGTVGHIVLDIYAFRFLTLTLPKYRAPLRTPRSSCDKFVKHAPLLREEIG
ncbi:hypothetical protein AVEN_86904-1 [Araneus ventricosus]|uniref:Uncharacterized protein n=1 Tax=Araneus ventricosus TaxID=182803 RepID=A0A4Y2X9Z1_ARAVE|nr:hypothetical protein AVEN_86904-1 [Araneus ventricosus]